MIMPLNPVGGPSATEIIQQAFSPAIAVLASPDVDLVCSKNRLTFVELLQPFSRLSVEGQIRDVNQVLHSVNQLRLSIREISWKPASSILAKRLLSDAVISCTTNDNKVIVVGDGDTQHSIEVNPQTPWFDSWRETLWNCLELTDHDFTRHYLGSLLVVSSTHPNPLEQFQQLNEQLAQLMSSNGTGDGPRWFNMMSLRYHVLVHDSCDGDASKAEGLYQALRNTYGAQLCHLLVINSKPKKGSIIDSGLPAPDPWLRFLPRKHSKSEISMDGESVVDGVDSGDSELPVKVVEGSNLHSLGALPKIPLMDALQEAMQEININSIFPPSASTTALSSLSANDGNGMKANVSISQRSAVEIKDDPLNAVQGNALFPQLTSTESDGGDGGGITLAPGIVENDIHGGCLTTEDLDRIQGLINEFCLKTLLPHMERQMKLLHESAASRKSTHRSLLSATKRWFGSNRPGGVQTPQTVAVSYHPESPQLQIRRLGDLAFLLGHYELAYNSYHSAKKDFESDQAWLHYAGATEMAALSVFLQNNQNRNIPFHYFDKALTTYLQTCKMPYWATRCAVLASECLKSANQFSEAALQLIRLTSEDADLRSAVLLEQAALCFLRVSNKPQPADSSKPTMTPLIRKYAFHMILAGHRFGKSGQKRHAARAYQLALQVYKGHGWSLAEDHIHYTVGRQCLNRQQIEAACIALAALLKPDSMQTSAQQTAYLNEFIHVHQLLNKHQANEANGLANLPVLPLPVIECNKIRILVDTKVSTEIHPPGILEATHVTFSDEEVHDTKWALMEEELVLSAFGKPTIPIAFRPTNILFSETTNNTSHPQAFCHDLISFEIPLTNPLRIPVQLCDIKLVWNFSGTDIKLSSLNLALDNHVVTTYVVPRIVLNHSSSHKVILSVKPKVEGMLSIEGIAFDLRPVNVDPTAAVAGLVSSVSGQVTFSIRGPRLNGTQLERHNKMYAVDNRLSIQVGKSTPKLKALFHSLPEYLFSGEIRSVAIELSNISPSIPMGDVILASNDPLNVAIDLPRIESANSRSNDLALYRWDPSKKSTSMWLRGTENVGLTSLDLMFLYTSPAMKPKYRLLRHCSKIFVSSSLKLEAWFQTVPSGEDRAETLAVQLQARNLRDADDTSLSGIEVYQVALLGNRWKLRPKQSVLPEGLLHPQESLFGVLMAVRDSKSSDHSESVTLKLPASGRAVDFKQEPCRTFVKQFQKLTPDTTIVVCWTATQAAEDGLGTSIIEGQHYFGLNSQETSSSIPSDSNVKSPAQLIIYSMEYSSKVLHNFNKQRLCFIPVTLYLHNCSQQQVEVNYSANSNAGKPVRASQLYLPEAAAPLLWIGRVQGKIIMKDKPETVQLTVAVSRPGAYSLVQGLSIDSSILGVNVKVTSPKFEYTLIVDHSEEM